MDLIFELKGRGRGGSGPTKLSVAGAYRQTEEYKKYVLGKAGLEGQTTVILSFVGILMMRFHVLRVERFKSVYVKRQVLSTHTVYVVDATRLGAWLRSGEGIGWLAAGTMPNSLYRVPFVDLFLAYVFCYSCSFLFVVFVCLCFSFALFRAL